jgi:hypothetical protein
MATDRPLIRRRRIFGCEVETTTGTAETIDDASGAYNAYDVTHSPNIEMVEREQSGTLSRLDAIPGPRMGTLGLKTYLAGNGASGSPTWASTLLKACGFTNSGAVYSPDSDGQDTLTMAALEDGRINTMAGCMGTFTWTFEAGKPAVSQWDFTGKLFEPQAQSLISPTRPTVTPPRFTAATLTLGGSAIGKTSQVTIAMNNNIVMREDVTADDDSSRSGDGTGYHAAYIVGRDITVMMDPEAVAFVTKNWYEDWMDGDELALSLVLGGDSNNTITIAMPKLQPHNVQPGDRNGLMVDQITSKPNANSDTGDNEMTVTFS